MRDFTGRHTDNTLTYEEDRTREVDRFLSSVVRASFGVTDEEVIARAFRHIKGPAWFTWTGHLERLTRAEDSAVQQQLPVFILNFMQAFDAAFKFPADAADTDDDQVWEQKGLEWQQDDPRTTSKALDRICMMPFELKPAANDLIRRLFPQQGERVIGRVLEEVDSEIAGLHRVLGRRDITRKMWPYLLARHLHIPVHLPQRLQECLPGTKDSPEFVVMANTLNGLLRGILVDYRAQFQREMLQDPQTQRYKRYRSVVDIAYAIGCRKIKLEWPTSDDRPDRTTAEARNATATRDGRPDQPEQQRQGHKTSTHKAQRQTSGPVKNKYGSGDGADDARESEEVPSIVDACVNSFRALSLRAERRLRQKRRQLDKEKLQQTGHDLSPDEIRVLKAGYATICGVPVSEVTDAMVLHDMPPALNY